MAYYSYCQGHEGCGDYVCIIYTYIIHIAICDNWISNYNLLLSDHEKGIGDIVQQYKYQYQVLYTRD